MELNGDDPLTVRQRVAYIAHNLRRNISLGRGEAASRFFRANPADLRAQARTQSPSRLLTELFIGEILPLTLPPSRVDVLELGCGSGWVCRSLSKLGYSGTYTGIDVVAAPGQRHTPPPGFDIRFVQSDAHDYVPDHPYDLVVSVSALEHICDDASLIARIASFVRPGGVQLHVVPSGFALFCYLWHGWRQYPAGAISDSFDRTRTQLFRLGGAFSFMLHVVFITLPEVFAGISLRSRMPNLYRWLAITAIRADRWLPFAPAAYAVLERR